MSHPGTLWLAAMVMLAACASPAPGPEEQTQGGGGGPLLASIKAAAHPDSIHFTLQVTNTTSAPVTLNFRSGQSFDFMVERGGREVWRWSGDRMFTQALRSETLAAGETRTFTAAWAPAPREPGEYTVTGVLTAEPGVQQSTRFRLD